MSYSGLPLGAASHAFLKAILSLRKFDRGVQAPTGGVAERDSRAMVAGNGFDDGQPESRAVRLCRRAPIKAVKDPVSFSRGDAGARIGDLEQSPLGPRAAAHQDGTLRWRIAHRIIDEVSREDAKRFAIAP